jgi:hypothetical protein
MLSGVIFTFLVCGLITYINQIWTESIEFHRTDTLKLPCNACTSFYWIFAEKSRIHQQAKHLKYNYLDTAFHLFYPVKTSGHFVRLMRILDGRIGLANTRLSRQDYRTKVYNPPFLSLSYNKPVICMLSRYPECMVFYWTEQTHTSSKGRIERKHRDMMHCFIALYVCVALNTQFVMFITTLTFRLLSRKQTWKTYWWLRDVQ